MLFIVILLVSQLYTCLPRNWQKWIWGHAFQSGIQKMIQRLSSICQFWSTDEVPFLNYALSPKLNLMKFRTIIRTSIQSAAFITLKDQKSTIIQGNWLFPLSFTWHLKIYRKSFSRIGILKKLGDCITEASCICHDVLLVLYACKKGSMAAVSGNGSVHHGGLVQNHSLNDLIFKGNNWTCPLASKWWENKIKQTYN